MAVALIDYFVALVALFPQTSATGATIAATSATDCHKAFVAAAAAAMKFFVLQLQPLREGWRQQSACVQQQSSPYRIQFLKCWKQHITEWGRNVDILDGILDRFFSAED